MKEIIKKDHSPDIEPQANTTFQQMTDKLKEDGLPDFSLAIIEAGKPIIQEILIASPQYFFSLKAKQFVTEITEMAQKVADEKGSELLSEYYYKPSLFVKLFRRIFIKIYIQVRKGNEEIIDEIKSGNYT